MSKDRITNDIPESVKNALLKDFRRIADLATKNDDETPKKKPPTPKEIPVIRLLAFFISEDEIEDVENLVDGLHDILIQGEKMDVEAACLTAGAVTGIAVKILALKTETALVLSNFSAAVTEYDGILSLELIDMATGMATRIDDLSDNDMDDNDDDDDDWFI